MALKLFNDSGVAKLQAKDGEESITATADGAVKLYYDNAEKLATTATGVDVTGGVATTTSIDVSGTDSKLNLTATNTGADHSINGASSVGALAVDVDINSEGSDSRLVVNMRGTEAMRIDASRNLKFNSGYGSVTTAYGVRAWVNFNASGTVSVRGSGNVSSVTDNGVGYFTINFATAMPDGNYSVGSWARNNTTTVWNVTVGSLTSLAAPSTTALPIFCRDDGRASVDPTYVTLNIIR